MKRTCQGYCGGYVSVDEIVVVEDGEQFCPDCAKSL